MIFNQTWTKRLSLITLSPILFSGIQFFLFLIAAWLVDLYFFDNDSSWYEGPLGGIHQVPVFLFSSHFLFGLQLLYVED